MTEPILSRAAELDLQKIAVYVGRRSPRAAERVVRGIRARAAFHTQFPDLGIPRFDLRPDLRYFLSGRYVIFYRKIADTILILRVLHSARDVFAIIAADLGL